MKGSLLSENLHVQQVNFGSIHHIIRNILMGFNFVQLSKWKFSEKKNNPRMCITIHNTVSIPSFIV